MAMKLKQLHISAPESWHPDYKEGKLRGEIEMEGLHAKVAVKLNDEQCRQILAIVGQAAKETTQAAVEAMTAEVFNLPTTPALENGSES